MTVPRYDCSGQWLKGNTHIHSTNSDGGKTPVELAAMYAAAGYDFLVRADHWVASDAAAEGQDYPLLWLDGVELDGPDDCGSRYHVVCIGRFTGIDRAMGLEAAMEAARSQGGFIILAHPHWMGNTCEDALRHGFDAVEIYNHVCRWLNGKSDSTHHWNKVLEVRPNTVGLAVDDAHIREDHPGWNGGWIMVNVTEKSAEAIVTAIRAGNFYSTTGPQFESISLNGNAVTVRTSPVQFVRLAGRGWDGKRVGSFNSAQLVTEATFEIPEGWEYAYIEIEDAQGHRAWTNTLVIA
ncbi:MAG: hypothetical protein JXL80_17070 [Planctomycetes bacterium]|nr:hypothetical protein [Planctomycetota bacterium]